MFRVAFGNKKFLAAQQQRATRALHKVMRGVAKYRGPEVHRFGGAVRGRKFQGRSEMGETGIVAAESAGSTPSRCGAENMA